MNKRIYYKKLNKFINENINKKIYGKIIYHDICKECNNRSSNCRIECDALPEHFNFKLENKEFNTFINVALGNNIDLDISEKEINNILSYYTFRYKRDRYLKIVYKADYIKVKNDHKISPFDFDYDDELVGIFEVKDRRW